MGRPKRNPSEVRQAIRDALATGRAAAVGMTVLEMRTGMSQTNLRVGLRELVDAGEVERIEGRNGRWSVTCAYRLKARHVGATPAA